MFLHILVEYTEMREGSTPIRQQYLRIKRKYPQAIVLFRLGDFYETFDDDAKTVSRELDIVLTSREMGKGNRVPLAISRDVRTISSTMHWTITWRGWSTGVTRSLSANR